MIVSGEERDRESGGKSEEGKKRGGETREKE